MSQFTNVNLYVVWTFSGFVTDRTKMSKVVLRHQVPLKTLVFNCILRHSLAPRHRFPSTSEHLMQSYPSIHFSLSFNLVQKQRGPNIVLLRISKLLQPLSLILSSPYCNLLVHSSNSSKLLEMIFTSLSYQMITGENITFYATFLFQTQ